MYVKTFPNIVGNHGPQESKQRVFTVYDNFPASVAYCSRYCAGYLLGFHHERVVLVARQQVGIHKSRTYVGKAYIVMLHAGELGKALDIYVLKAFRRGVGRGHTEALCPGYGRDNGYVPCAFFGKIPVQLVCTVANSVAMSKPKFWRPMPEQCKYMSMPPSRPIRL